MGGTDMHAGWEATRTQGSQGWLSLMAQILVASLLAAAGLLWGVN